jgi:hypothetical protein
MHERKRIARLLLTDTTVTRTAGTITAHVRLRGGQHRTLTLPMPKTGPEARRTPPEVITAIDQLLDHHTSGDIARHPQPARPAQRHRRAIPPANARPTSANGWQYPPSALRFEAIGRRASAHSWTVCPRPFMA